MGKKAVDFNKTVYELCSGNPEILNILAGAGFSDITKPGMLNTAGRFMKIPDGARVKKINLEEVKKAFTSRGYDVIL